MSLTFQFVSQRMPLSIGSNSLISISHVMLKTINSNAILIYFSRLQFNTTRFKYLLHFLKLCAKSRPKMERREQQTSNYTNKASSQNGESSKDATTPPLFGDYFNLAFIKFVHYFNFKHEIWKSKLKNSFQEFFKFSLMKRRLCSSNTTSNALFQLSFILHSFQISNDSCPNVIKWKIKQRGVEGMKSTSIENPMDGSLCDDVFIIPNEIHLLPYITVKSIDELLTKISSSVKPIWSKNTNINQR